ncbi:MAG TPA: MFS transporter, partial [Pseudomonas sp.]|nr:MFS transporter [Pseudomonas sp.]
FRSEAQALAPGEALAAERSDRYRDDPPALPAGAGRVEPRL